MSKKWKARNKPDKRTNQPSGFRRSRNLEVLFVVAVLTFLSGAGMAVAGFLSRSYPNIPAADAGHGSHSVWELLALPDEQLGKVDVVEMDLDVARGVPGMEHLDIDHYRHLVDGWTKQFADWLPIAEQGFYRTPRKWKNDIRFFRIGMLAQFLDECVGVRYLPWSLEAQQEGKNDNHYTDPGDSYHRRNAGANLREGSRPICFAR